MAAGILPKPGSEFLCKGKCEHTDCNHIRQDAAALCRICQKPIGFGRQFYRDTTPQGIETGGLVHAICLAEEIERQAKARLDKALVAVRETAATYQVDELCQAYPDIQAIIEADLGER